MTSDSVKHPKNLAALLHEATPDAQYDGASHMVRCIIAQMIAEIQTHPHFRQSTAGHIYAEMVRRADVHGMSPLVGPVEAGKCAEEVMA